MPKPTTPTKARPMPTPAAPETLQDADAPLMPVRPMGNPAPKPTLWQRIWYGANAERRMATAQVPLNESLDEVKAGVLAEMQAMARTKGGVSGSPFANVMLPQEARIKPKAVPVAAPPKRRRWLVAFLLLVAAGWLLAQLASWRTVPLATAPVLSQETLLQPFPATAPAPQLLPAPVLPAQPKPAQAARAAQTQLGAAALAEIVQVGALSSGLVANRADEMVFTARLTNTHTHALEDLQLNLVVRDQADVTLLTRTLTVKALPAQQVATERFVLTLQPNLPEHLVATVPLRALKVSLVPTKAHVAK